jgi:hypothetical protein
VTTEKPVPQRVLVEMDVEQYKLLQAIGQDIRAQDNRCTDIPIFIVREKKRLYGVDPDYDSSHVVVWIDQDNEYAEADAEERTRLEAAWEESGDVPEGWTRTAYKEYWEFVTACFTEAGCKEYLRCNAHNLSETQISPVDPRVFAASSFRNDEFRVVRKFLNTLVLNAPVVVPAEKLAAEFLDLRDSSGPDKSQTLWLDMKHTDSNHCVQLAHGDDIRPIYDGCLSILTGLVKRARGEQP